MSLKSTPAEPNNSKPAEQTPSNSFLIKTYRYFTDRPHQQKAIAYLEQQQSVETLAEFTRLWRDDSSDPQEQPKRLVDKIVAYMKLKGYQIYTTDGKRNIVYVEGMNVDGTLNDDSPDVWNDIRCVFEYRDGNPEMLGVWGATTEPGRYYTENPLNPDGCARIQFGQYKAWQVGSHGTSQPHEALVQCDNITVCRDLNEDYSRKGDQLYTGDHFGVNQHWGGDSPIEAIGRWSAGCLVGRTRDGHREFMKIVKEDPDYLRNRAYAFATTVIAGDDLVKLFPD